MDRVTISLISALVLILAVVFVGTVFTSPGEVTGKATEDLQFNPGNLLNANALIGIVFILAVIIAIFYVENMRVQQD